MDWVHWFDWLEQLTWPGWLGLAAIVVGVVVFDNGRYAPTSRLLAWIAIGVGITLVITQVIILFV